MTSRGLLHRLRFWRGWGRELSAEIDRRLRPLEEAGEKQVIIDIWVLRQLLNRPPGIAAVRPTKLTKEASDELIAEAKDELAVLREKAKGRRPRKEERRAGGTYAFACGAKRRKLRCPTQPPAVGSSRRGNSAASRCQEKFK